jgi:hypothetical protein
MTLVYLTFLQTVKKFYKKVFPFLYFETEYYKIPSCFSSMPRLSTVNFFILVMGIQGYLILTDISLMKFC